MILEELEELPGGRPWSKGAKRARF